MTTPRRHPARLTPNRAPREKDGGRLRDSLETLGAVIAPPTLLTALGLYLGWRRTDSYARYFGIDQSVLRYDTQDFLLRSWQSAHQVVFALVLGAIVAAAGHLALTRTRWGRVHHVVSLAIALISGAVLLVQLASWFVPPLDRWISGVVYYIPYLTPYAITAFAVASLAYSGLLLWRGRGARAAPIPRGPLKIAGSLVAVLLFLGVLSATDKYISILGGKDAEYMSTTLPERQGVIVYSAQDLALSDPVTCTELTGPNRAYRFRCEGLRLYLRSADTYFLLPATWSQADTDPRPDRLIVLRDDPSVRLEFTPPSPSR
ncbi:hypothetical protein [Amycolatopsis sp. CA-230715]|uniref:hypothetical protein n=1 Tax=Amycolatopsis sp. CA-230715 TaxID=2745196 RepID=UPI001C00CAF9|nr:hypothetical protein [Amycolatopsis sp. CA-230715]QWF85937.1 hypothetical protein HUW46_09418 [Amycolatopsis sp. CA-230715]